MTTASSTVTNNVTFHEILRPKAIAVALGISRPSVYRLLLNGKIPSVRLTDFAVGAYSKDVTAYLARLNPANFSASTAATEISNVGVNHV